jgi:tRNA(fMet)-specific endonuclease VapC
MSGKDYLLDTNIVVAFFNGDPTIVQQVNRLSIVQLSSVVIGELYYGAFKSAKTQQNIERIRSFLSLCNVLSSDTETSYWYGHIRENLRKKGKPIPENDIWIAATARQHQLILVSRDKHFDEVDSLSVEVW